MKKSPYLLLNYYGAQISLLVVCYSSFFTLGEATLSENLIQILICLLAISITLLEKLITGLNFKSKRGIMLLFFLLISFEPMLILFSNLKTDISQSIAVCHFFMIIITPLLLVSMFFLSFSKNNKVNILSRLLPVVSSVVIWFYGIMYIGTGA